MSAVRETSTSQKPPKWLAIPFLIAGAVIAAVAIGIIPAPPGAFHAPRSIVFLVGVVFFSGGVVILGYDRPAIRKSVPPLVVLCMGTIALWVSAYGDAQQFGGNLPVAPQNQVGIARIAFGIGGALCYLLVLIMTLRNLFRRSQATDESRG